jgi:beta-fructofuranosidase
LCQINGLYHVFYQYRPDAADGSGRVFWGHSVSEDLLHWEFKGAPIAPDTDLDKNGAYSGSALVENGVMKLFYTGNVKLPGDYDYTTAGRLSNTILVESRDGGATFTPKKAVMTNADYPADISCHIRDPKVWKEDGKSPDDKRSLRVHVGVSGPVHAGRQEVPVPVPAGREGGRNPVQQHLSVRLFHS